MKYDDLINIPYKVHGRDSSGLDCYGLVLECCRRAGTPLNDLYYESDRVPAENLTDYIYGGLNIQEIPEQQVGSIAEMEYNGKLHVGFVVGRNLIIHTTYNAGVKVSPAAALKIKRYYEVKQ